MPKTLRMLPGVHVHGCVNTRERLNLMLIISDLGLREY
jgi:hypothetical protein